MARRYRDSEENLGFSKDKSMIFIHHKPSNNKSASPLELPRHVHVIGICGVATSALAIAFHNKGIKVTGSDKGFFPPISTELEKHNISFYAGWHVEKMIESGLPDIVIVGTASGSQNPETTYADANNIKKYSYPEVIGEYFAKENSIICAGTWGKTSSSALLSHIFEKANLNPSYMFGGVSLSHDSSARLTESNWSIFEGDEYKSSPTDLRAKFFHYKPTHLLLSAVSWDHADLYPTETEYFEAFRKLMAIIPKRGFVVACADNDGVKKILDGFDGKTVLYGNNANSKMSGTADLDYSYDKIIETDKGISFTIYHKGKSFEIISPLLGAYQAQNITGCFAMAHEHNISTDSILSAIADFSGLKRRLERRLDGKLSGNGITIFDDIAHSPEKASATIGTLRNIYKGKIIVIFEPNSGGRSRESAPKYSNAFNKADIVIIPRLTKLKVSTDKSDQPMEGDELAMTIKKTHSDTIYIDHDIKLVEYLISTSKKGDVIAFLGSHGFRGMIEELIERIK
ncbi:MAG: Mur ligase family protein [Candidatus Paceibacterota bacterium]